MIISNANLPSQGKFSKYKSNLEILPFTFRQLVQYTSHPEPDEVAQYKKDIEYLHKNGVNLEHVSLLDLDYLIFMQKAISISEDVKFSSSTIDENGDNINFEFNISQITFKNFDDFKIPSKVTLDNLDYKIMIPSVSQFVDNLDRYMQYNQEVDLSIIKLLSVFKDYSKSPYDLEKVIMNSRSGGPDAATLFYLDSYIFDRVNEIEVKRSNKDSLSVSIDITKLTKDFFRLYLILNKPTEHQVYFE